MDLHKLSQSIEMNELTSSKITLNYSNLKLFPQNNSTTLEINNCTSFDDATNLITSEKFLDFYQKSPQLIAIFVEVNEKFKFLEDSQLDEIEEVFNARTILISFHSKIDNKFFLYWKLQDRMKMVMLEVIEDYSEDLKIVRNFLRNFLMTCLKNDETGLPPSLSPSEINSFVKLHNLSDALDRTVLMIAAEEGNLTAVNYFIKSSFQIMYTIKGEIAIDFAYKNGNYDVVLALLKANSPFPRNFDVNVTHDELKAFVNLMMSMHESIKTEDIERVFMIVEENPELRYFYNLENTSAMAHATQLVSIDIFETLMLKNLLYGVTENYNDIVSTLSYEDGEKLRQINFKNARNFTEKHIMTLMANSTIRHGSKDTPQKFNHVLNALTILNNIPGIKKILELAAAAQNLQLVFDFENEILQYLDPTAGPYTDGSFYMNCGQIAIAAKKLLDPKTQHFVLGALAHELCHFAMHLLHKNDAKPFGRDDEEGESTFAEISNFCELNKDKEIIISWVYGYGKNMQLAELIVRVPHILAHYYNDHDKIKELTEIFQSLFNFFNTRSLPEMERKIPEIEEELKRQNEAKFVKQKKKISLLRKIILFLLFLAPIGIIATVYIVYSPKYSWDSLEDFDRSKFDNAVVEFHGVKIKFKDLFANDSKVYSLLSSENIESGLNNDTESLSNAIASTYDQFIYLNWNNMTDGLRKKFLKLDVNFQGKILKFDEILLNKSSLNFLNPQEIRESFNGIILNILSPLEKTSKFFIDRFLIDESDLNKKKKGKKENFESLQSEIESSKVFLLSNQAGEGKSTLLRHYATLFKDLHPTRWVQFVDLKKYTNVYDKRNGKSLSDFLVEIFNLQKLEKQIFIECFGVGKIIFLWDGVDEIAPKFTYYILGLTYEIKKDSDNIQLISTRPQYSQDFKSELQVKVFNLVSLDKSHRIKLLINHLVGETFESNSSNFADFLWKYKNVLKPILNNTKDFDFKLENLNEFSNNLKNNSKLVEFIYLNIYLKTQNEYERDLREKEIGIIIGEMFGSSSSGEILEENLNNTKNSVKNVSNSLQNPQIIDSFSNSLQNPQIINSFSNSPQNVIKSDLNSDDLKPSNLSQNPLRSNLNSLQNPQFIDNHLNSPNHSKNLNLNSSQYREISDIKLDPLRIPQNQQKFNSNSLQNPQLIDNNLNPSRFSQNQQKISSNSLQHQQKINLKSLQNPQFIDNNLNFSNQLQNQLKNDLNSLKSLQNPQITEINLNPLNSSTYQQIIDNYLNFSQSNLQLFYIFLTNRNKSLQILSFIDKGQSILDSIERKESIYLVTNPLLIRMIAEIVGDENFQSKENFNFYSVFETFMYKKIEIFLEKGLAAKDAAILFLLKSKFNLMQIHQAYALKQIYGEHIRVHIELKIEDFSILESIKYLTYDQITRVGILYVNSTTDFSFAHRTFGEFLICRYLNDTIDKLDSKDTSMNLRLFNSVLFGPKYFVVVKSFLLDHIQAEDEIPEIFKILKVIFRKLEGVTENIKIINFFTFAEASKYFKNFNLNLYEYFIEESFSWNFFEMRELLDNWNNFQNHLGYESIFNALTTKVSKGHNILFEMTENVHDDFFLDFLNKLNETLKRDDLKSLIFSCDDDNQTVLMFTAFTRAFVLVEKIWDLIEENSDSNLTLKNLLKFEDIYYMTVLHMSAGNQDPQVFKFFKNLYEIYFTTEEIREMLLKTHKDALPFIHHLINNGLLDTINFVSKYMDSLFEDDKIRLRELLVHENKAGKNIFTIYESATVFKDSLYVFEKMLQSTFPRLEVVDFYEYFRVINNDPMNDIKFSEMNSQSFKNFLSRIPFWFCIDFEDLTTNYEKIRENLGEENFKQLLMNKILNSLHHILYNETNYRFLEPMLNVLKTSLNSSDIYSILTQEEPENNATPFMLAAWKGKFEIFVKFIQNFTDFTIKEFLLMENQLCNTALQFSTFNSNPNIFLNVKSFYENILTVNKTKEIILKTDNQTFPFIFDLIESSHQKTPIEVSKYLRTAFKDEKSKLREFLSFREDYGEGDSIFKYFKNKKANERNLNIFKDLLRETVEDFDVYLNNLESDIQ